MGSKRYIKEKVIRVFEQMIALRTAYPTAKCQNKKNTLWWCGKIRPTPLSKEYNVVMTYTLWKSPTVYICGDELEKLDDSEFPHKYHIDLETKLVEICLYRYREFSAYKFLSKTIIPWTIEWLFFYEIWLSTGEWCGGGDHPDAGEAKEKADGSLPTIEEIEKELSE